MAQGFADSQMAKDALAFHCPRWAELPGIDLYMDQLSGYINGVFQPLYGRLQDDPMLTKAMVNNYVKQRVIERPTNKKYNKSQLAQLIAICALKQVFSIPEVCVLVRTGLESYPIERAYDYFCVELEHALEAAFRGEDAPRPDTAAHPSQVSLLVRRATLAYASKVYVQKRVDYIWQTKE